MRENTLNLPGGSFIAHDKEKLDLIRQTNARMFFPEQKDKRKRNSFLNALNAQRANTKQPGPSSICDETKKQNYKGSLVGEVFRVQNLLTLQWDEFPSIRFLWYATKQKIILSQWPEQGYPVQRLRTIYSQFRPVKHLWCADAYICLLYREDGLSSNYPLQSLWEDPGFFLSVAAFFRERAVEKGLEKKSMLWMPKKWRVVTEDIKPNEIEPNEIFFTPEWEKLRENLEKLWQWYREGREWEDKDKKRKYKRSE
jgi:hypothetical protein